MGPSANLGAQSLSFFFWGGGYHSSLGPIQTVVLEILVFGTPFVGFVGEK